MNPSRPIALAVCLFLFGVSGGAVAQDQAPASTPVPTPVPGGETAVPQGTPAKAEDLPAEAIPVPVQKPGEAGVNEHDAKPGDAVPAAVPTPVTEPPGKSDKPGDNPGAGAPATDDEAGAPDGTQGGGDDASTQPAETPQPAYVSPDKARTVPEPSAPETPEAPVTPAQSVEAAEALLDAETCEGELKRRGVEFSVGDSISEEECGVLRPVLIKRLSTGVTVSPDTQMLCRTALALDIWVAEGVVAAARKELPGEKLSAITHASTYVCRARASESRISEHSRGSAIDIAAFRFGSGKDVAAQEQAPDSKEDRFLADSRRAACGPFRTVLGPGTDADHDTHFHLDIAARNNGSTYCR